MKKNTLKDIEKYARTIVVEFVNSVVRPPILDVKTINVFVQI